MQKLLVIASTLSYLLTAFINTNEPVHTEEANKPVVIVNQGDFVWVSSDKNKENITSGCTVGFMNRYSNTFIFAGHCAPHEGMEIFNEDRDHIGTVIKVSYKGPRLIRRRDEAIIEYLF